MSAAPARRLDPDLVHLARAFGVETSFIDAFGEQRVAGPEVVLAVLRALGARADTPADVAPALAHARRRAWQTLLAPALVAWDARPLRVGLRLPARLADRDLEVRIGVPAGAAGTPSCSRQALRAVPVAGTAAIDGAAFVRKFVTLPAPPGNGVYPLAVEVGDLRARSWLIAAPVRASAEDAARIWGIFLPLHAVRAGEDWGCGDYAGLGALARFAAARGAGLLGTLPLLAPHPTALANPYTPSSRRFWNEIYIDVAAVPELAHCPRARAIVAAPDFQEDLRRARAGKLTDPVAVGRMKTRVLGELFGCLGEGTAERRAAFARFLERRPDTLDYGRFTAVQEQRAQPWSTWPQRLRDGDIGPGDHDPQRARCHAYLQWIAHEQLEMHARAARTAGVRLYLDLPLGVHPDGYDAWRERDVFLRGLRVGAPPDRFFVHGQDWGMPPLHPQRIRAQGYRYFAECLRHHLSVAPWLRIDHAMGFHHLYVMPAGASAQEGVYLRYRAEEFYAVAGLEAERSGGSIVGEDLGTVPETARTAMARHGIKRMYVLPFAVDPEREPPLGEPDPDQIASLGTHDTPTFQAFWTAGRAGSDGASPQGGGEDGDRERVRAALARCLAGYGLPGASGAWDTADVLRAALTFLLRSPACAVLVNLEDLWLEPLPQNVPGTGPELPNWRRRSRYTLAEIEALASVRQTLAELARLRPRR